MLEGRREGASSRAWQAQPSPSLDADASVLYRAALLPVCMCLRALWRRCAHSGCQRACAAVARSAVPACVWSLTFCGRGRRVPVSMRVSAMARLHAPALAAVAVDPSKHASGVLTRQGRCAATSTVGACCLVGAWRCWAGVRGLIWALVCTVWNTTTCHVGVRHCLVLQGSVRKVLKAPTRLQHARHWPVIKVRIAGLLWRPAAARRSAWLRTASKPKMALRHAIQYYYNVSHEIHLYMASGSSACLQYEKLNSSDLCCMPGLNRTICVPLLAVHRVHPSTDTTGKT